nr:DUF4406 domain-containing protein [uncultured Albidiferax sp.]
MKIYIAGPMTGLPGFNYPAFNAMADKLRQAGHEALNPAENPVPQPETWVGYMRSALAQLVTADAILLLPGWHLSKGARVELQVATALDLVVVPPEGEFEGWVRVFPQVEPVAGVVANAAEVAA